MKKFYFNIQSKGGAGKSMLTYLQALLLQNDDRAYFIDLDSSVKSSHQQLKFLHGKNPPRFAMLSLMDLNQKLDRHLLFEYLFQLYEKDYDSFYLDFGAQESDHLPALLTKDYSIKDFKMMENEMKAQFIFNVVLAGGLAYEQCTTYLQKITELMNGSFEVNMYINQFSFSGNPHLIKELQDFAISPAVQISSVKLFGNLDVNASPHKSILQKISEGRGREAFGFVENFTINNELKKLTNDGTE